MIMRKKLLKRKERGITIIGALLLIAGGWAVFSLTKYGFDRLLGTVGVQGEVYQNLAIIILVILFFVFVAGQDTDSTFNKLLKI